MLTCAGRHSCAEAKDEEGEETEDLAYVPMVPPLETDEEGNEIEPEGYVKMIRTSVSHHITHFLHTAATVGQQLVVCTAAFAALAPMDIEDGEE